MHIAICTASLLPCFVSISVACTGSALTRTSNYAESYKLTQSWVSTFMHLISSRVCKFVNWGVLRSFAACFGTKPSSNDP